MDVIQDRKSDGSGTSVVNYVNGPGIDDKLKQTTGTTTSYFLTDHLGSTVGLVDQAGSITSQTAYDSFGNASTQLPTRYGYTGRELDEYTGLMYYRARFYDPQIGRFISEDPIGFGGGDINLYGYVRNNPLRFNDPLGLMTPAQKCFLKGAAIGAAAGAVLGGAIGGGIGVLGIAGGPLVVATVAGGAAAGASYGAGIGVLIGGAIGGFMCMDDATDEPCDKSSPQPTPSPSPSPTPSPTPAPSPSPTPPFTKDECKIIFGLCVAEWASKAPYSRGRELREVKCYEAYLKCKAGRFPDWPHPPHTTVH
jgi:RHS repeat-associated protein